MSAYAPAIGMFGQFRAVTESSAGGGAARCGRRGRGGPGAPVRVGRRRARVAGGGSSHQRGVVAGGSARGGPERDSRPARSRSAASSSGEHSSMTGCYPGRLGQHSFRSRPPPVRRRDATGALTTSARGRLTFESVRQRDEPFAPLARRPIARVVTGPPETFHPASPGVCSRGRSRGELAVERRPSRSATRCRAAGFPKGRGAIPPECGRLDLIQHSVLRRRLNGEHAKDTRHADRRDAAPEVSGDTPRRQHVALGSCALRCHNGSSRYRQISGNSQARRGIATPAEGASLPFCRWGS